MCTTKSLQNTKLVFVHNLNLQRLFLASEQPLIFEYVYNDGRGITYNKHLIYALFPLPVSPTPSYRRMKEVKMLNNGTGSTQYSATDHQKLKYTVNKYALAQGF